MAKHNLFPSIVPGGNGNEIPRYRDMDWDQLRVFVATLEDVSAKQKRAEIEADLDEKYGIDGEEEYDRVVRQTNMAEYNKQFE